MRRAVVFGYGDVGVRCLATVLAHGVAVPLVVTHRDDPAETRWFSSLARFAGERDIPVVYSESESERGLLERVRGLRPDLIFSFYYRRMLSDALLGLAGRAALNMHGSLLPKYRGRAPVNWAILNGEIETGATLHYMTAKPDAGAIVAQRAVPICPDDTALDVFRKVCSVAEIILDESLPGIVDGVIRSSPQDLSSGSYFGARRPEDGIIDWSQPASRIHNLVRAVALPYPGARTVIDDQPARILRTLHAPEIACEYGRPALFARDDRCYVECGDRRVLRLLEIEIDGKEVTPEALAQRARQRPISLGDWRVAR